MNVLALALLVAGFATDDRARTLEELKRSRPLGPFPVPREVAKVPENLRGFATDVAGELVVINVGADAGLGVGMVLDLYRTDGDEKRYLGQVKVTSALNLFPKQAIVTFTPARNVPLDKLRPEEFPKKGDQVRPPEALTGNKP